jgi:hypothetical protein
MRLLSILSQSVFVENGHSKGEISKEDICERKLQVPENPVRKNR